MNSGFWHPIPGEKTRSPWISERQSAPKAGCSESETLSVFSCRNRIKHVSRSQWSSWSVGCPGPTHRLLPLSAIIVKMLPLSAIIVKCVSRLGHYREKCCPSRPLSWKMLPLSAIISKNVGHRPPPQTGKKLCGEGPLKYSSPYPTTHHPATPLATSVFLVYPWILFSLM